MFYNMPDLTMVIMTNKLYKFETIFYFLGNTFHAEIMHPFYWL